MQNGNFVIGTLAQCHKWKRHFPKSAGHYTSCHFSTSGTASVFINSVCFSFQYILRALHLFYHLWCKLCVCLLSNLNHFKHICACFCIRSNSNSNDKAWLTMLHLCQVCFSMKCNFCIKNWISQTMNENNFSCMPGKQWGFSS